MDIQLLLATTPGQGPTPAGKSGPGAQGGFSQELSRAGIRPLADGGQPASGAERPPTLLLAPGGDLALARGSLEVMMQALGDGAPTPGHDAHLAEIAERLALIEAAGRDDAAMPADDLARLAREAEALATRIDTAEVSPEAVSRALPEGAPPDTTTWPALAMAGQIPPGAPGRDAQSPAANAGRARPVDVEMAATGAPTDRGAPRPLDAIRAAGEARPPALPAEPAPAVRADTRPVAADARLAEPRSESFSALLNGQTATTGPATTTPVAQASVSAPLASPAWPQQFTHQVGQQLALFSQRGGEQRVELHLNPAELGPLTVSLKVSEQAAQAQFLSAHAPVRSAVEQAIPQLREALAEQGISLGEASVGEQSRDEAPRDFAGRGTTGGPAGEEVDGPGASAPAVAADISLDGRVDLYA